MVSKKMSIRFFFVFILFCALFMKSAYSVALPTALSTNVCADELLLDLANPNQILAVTHYSKPRHQKLLKNNNLAVYRGQTEEILSLKPDLVVTGVFDAPLTTQLFEKFEIKTLRLDIPKNFEEIIEQIHQLAKALNQENKGLEIANNIEQELNELNSNHPFSGKRAVFWGYEGHVPGLETYENDLLEKLGLTNIAGDFGIHGHGWISIEKLIQSKPDFLILEEKNSALSSVGEKLLNHPAIQAALPDLKIISLEENSLRCGGPYLIHVLQNLQSALSAYEK